MEVWEFTIYRVVFTFYLTCSDGQTFCCYLDDVVVGLYLTLTNFSQGGRKSYVSLEPL